MNSSLHRCVLAVGLVACSVLNAQGQIRVLNTSHLLPTGARCDNVIHLMHCHGVNNSVDRALSNSILHHSPSGSVEIPGQSLGDLEIIGVTQILHDDPACGPKIAVVVQNQSVRQVHCFHVSVVAMLGRICPTSPNATVKIGPLAPGQTLEVAVQLPIEAFAMGNRNGQIIGFQRLVVAIDSLDELLESNEANNLRAIDRADLQIVSATVVETVSETAEAEVQQQTIVPEAGVDGGASPGPQTQAPDDLQSAIRKLGTENSNVIDATNSL